MSKIESLGIYQEIVKLYPEASALEVRKILCSVPVLISVAAQDKKLTKDEITYLKRYTRYFLDLEKEKADHLAKYICIAYKEDKVIRDNIGNFVSWINSNFSEEDREEFVATLFVISRSDGNISEQEKGYIYKIAKRLELSDQVFNENLLKAGLILANKVFEQIKNDKYLETDDDEYRDYEIMSAKTITF